MVGLLSRSNISTELHSKIQRKIQSKSKLVFKIALNKLIDNYSRIKNSTLSLHFLKKHLNANEFK